MEPEERYHRDPLFRAIVDTLEAGIHQAQYTPTEVREAAVLACIHYEQRKPPVYYTGKGGSFRIK